MHRHASGERQKKLSRSKMPSKARMKSAKMNRRARNKRSLQRLRNRKKNCSSRGDSEWNKPKRERPSSANLLKNSKDGQNRMLYSKHNKKLTCKSLSRLQI